MASCGNEIHLGDIGTAFRVTLNDCNTPVDLTGYTDLEILFQKPSGNDIARAATIFGGDPANGIIEYVTVLDDLDEVGSWRIQAHVTLPTGEWKSDIERFRVYSNLS